MKTFQLFYDRWVAKSPWRAKLVTTIAATCAVVVGFPEMLAFFDIAVPLVFQPYVTKIITASLTLLAIIGKLTVKKGTILPHEKTDK